MTGKMVSFHGPSMLGLLLMSSLGFHVCDAARPDRNKLTSIEKEEDAMQCCKTSSQRSKIKHGHIMMCQDSCPPGWTPAAPEDMSLTQENGWNNKCTQCPVKEAEKPKEKVMQCCKPESTPMKNQNGQVMRCQEGCELGWAPAAPEDMFLTSETGWTNSCGHCPVKEAEKPKEVLVKDEDKFCCSGSDGSILILECKAKCKPENVVKKVQIAEFQPPRFKNECLNKCDGKKGQKVGEAPITAGNKNPSDPSARDAAGAYAQKKFTAAVTPTRASDAAKTPTKVCCKPSAKYAKVKEMQCQNNQCRTGWVKANPKKESGFEDKCTNSCL